MTSEQMLTALRRFVPDLSRDHGLHLMHSMHIDSCPAIDYLDFVAALTLLVEGDIGQAPAPPPAAHAVASLASTPVPHPHAAPPPPVSYPAVTPYQQEQAPGQQQQQQQSQPYYHPSSQYQAPMSGGGALRPGTGIFRVDVIPAAGTVDVGGTCRVPCALCPVPCALCPVPCALCPVPCAVCRVPCGAFLLAGVPLRMFVSCVMWRMSPAVFN